MFLTVSLLESVTAFGALSQASRYVYKSQDVGSSCFCTHLWGGAVVWDSAVGAVPRVPWGAGSLRRVSMVS